MLHVFNGFEQRVQVLLATNFNHLVLCKKEEKKTIWLCQITGTGEFSVKKYTPHKIVLEVCLKWGFPM